MAEKIPMLALSPTMKDGVIARWHKKEGDPIAPGDLLCEVETDKATMEYESTVAGTLLKILVVEGDKAAVGEPIAIAGHKGEDISGILEATPPAGTPAAKSTAPEKVPQIPVPEKTSPASVVGQRVKASPLARKMAKDMGIPLSAVAGSGPGGRIVQRDIEAAAGPKEVPAPSSGIGARVAPAARPAMVSEIVPITQKRRIIARRLSESQFSAPHYYLRLSVDMEQILSARKGLNDSLPEKVSLNAFFMKFSAEAIKRFPIINATWKGDSIEKHADIDIGLAVAQPDGLITPVVRNCGLKGILEIERELKNLVARALDNKLAPEEFQNATFTISNLGSFGIEEFTAIINPPGSAILALGEIGKQPVVVGDKIEIRTQMKMTLSCDHRIIDGAVGAAFLQELQAMMENPIRGLY